MKNSYVYEQNLLKRIDFQQHRPLSQIMYDALKSAILDGSFPLGERINENSLSEQLSISRTPIRKALDLLIKDGLLEYIPNYGTVVINVNSQKITEIFKIRSALELVLYEEVMDKISKDELADLTKLCNKICQLESVNAKDDLIENLNLYNEEIFRIANMSTLNAMLLDLNTYFKNFRNYSFSTKNRRSLAVKEHLIITNCLASKDKEMLRKAVSNHIENSKKAALETFIGDEKIQIQFNDSKGMGPKEHRLKFRCDMKKCPIKEK